MAPIFTGSRFGFGFAQTEGTPILFSASGGIEFTLSNINSPTGSYKYHVFTGPGIVTTFSPSDNSYSDITFMLVSGGGGGSPEGGGGGGGVLVNTGTQANLNAGTYSVTIGSGGGPGSNGNPSTLTIPGPGVEVMTATGGGAGKSGGNPGSPGLLRTKKGPWIFSDRWPWQFQGCNESIPD